MQCFHSPCIRSSICFASVSMSVPNPNGSFCTHYRDRFLCRSLLATRSQRPRRILWWREPLLCSLFADCVQKAADFSRQDSIYKPPFHHLLYYVSTMRILYGMWESKFQKICP